MGSYCPIRPMRPASASSVRCRTAQLARTSPWTWRAVMPSVRLPSVRHAWDRGGARIDLAEILPVRLADEGDRDCKIPGSGGGDGIWRWESLAGRCRLVGSRLCRARDRLPGCAAGRGEQRNYQRYAQVAGGDSDHGLTMSGSVVGATTRSR
jgi:hypothetical protein